MGYTWNPNIMASTDWKIVRNEYETLGTGIKELASSHHTTEALVRLAIAEGNWIQSAVEDMNNGTEDLSSRLAALEVRHQASLVPRFIALQGKMLEKCDMLLDGVRSLDDASNLKVVSEVIEKHRPAIMGDKTGDKADTAMTIRILTKVGNGEEVAVNAVEITTSAGETNGIGTGKGVPCGTLH